MKKTNRTCCKQKRKQKTFTVGGIKVKAKTERKAKEAVRVLKAKVNGLTLGE